MSRSLNHAPFKRSEISEQIPHWQCTEVADLFSSSLIYSADDFIHLHLKQLSWSHNPPIF
ncbi:MAG: hypothetical protein OFPII_40960 [Osedax symbiont Rs1]|nr:MAG: hypothetical protein OFPII_40960 [Osedax symbiont Rs1]